jgi:prepilin-type processing-associated H-X9-DG protein
VPDTAPPDPIPASFVSSCKNISHLPINHSFATQGYYQSHDNNTDRPPYIPGAPRTISFNDLPFGSFHDGGANFCFGDGAVRFLVDSIDQSVLQALASRNGAETVAAPE